MNVTDLALLWLAWVLAGASPGPATMALASTALSQGRATALALAAGIVAGSATWGLLAGLGLGALMYANAWAMEILRYLGALYILWLAFKSLRRAAQAGDPAMTAIRPMTASKAWFSGAALHITNPKAILSWGAVYAVVVPADAAAWQIAATGGFLMTGSCLVFFGYALVFSSEAAIRRYARARRWIEASFGLLFGAAALAILTARPS